MLLIKQQRKHTTRKNTWNYGSNNPKKEKGIKEANEIGSRQVNNLSRGLQPRKLAIKKQAIQLVGKQKSNQVARTLVAN